MPTEKFERLDTTRMAQILSVALDEFTRYRYGDASFNRIIRACQMAKGTMYYYFKSKDDLFLTLYKATARDFAALVRRAQAPLPDAQAFWLQLQRLLDELCSLLAQKPSTGLFVTNFLKPSSRADHHPAAPTIAAIDSWLLAFIQRGQELGAIRTDLSPEQLKGLSWSLWESSRGQAQAGETESYSPLDAAQLLSLFDRVMKPVPSPPLALAQGRRDLRDALPSL